MRYHIHSIVSTSLRRFPPLFIRARALQQTGQRPAERQRPGGEEGEADVGAGVGGDPAQEGDAEDRQHNGDDALAGGAAQKAGRLRYGKPDQRQGQRKRHRT